MLFGKRERHIRRILVVEDEPLVAFDNEYQLSDMGFEVVGTVDNILRPILSKEGLHFHPLLIFLALFGGIAAFGASGIYLGPLFVALFVAMARIYERETGRIHYGRVPSGSVVVPGSLPSPDGKYSLACAVIVKRVDARTRSKTSINDLLRGD